MTRKEVLKFRSNVFPWPIITYLRKRKKKGKKTKYRTVALPNCEVVCIPETLNH